MLISQLFYAAWIFFAISVFATLLKPETFRLLSLISGTALSLLYFTLSPKLVKSNRYPLRIIKNLCSFVWGLSIIVVIIIVYDHSWFHTATITGSLLMIALITVIILMRNRITSIVIYYKLMVHSLLLLLYLFLICFIQQYLLPAV
jgi:hypothetical protein